MTGRVRRNLPPSSRPRALTVQPSTLAWVALFIQASKQVGFCATSFAMPNRSDCLREASPRAMSQSRCPCLGSPISTRASSNLHWHGGPHRDPMTSFPRVAVLKFSGPVTSSRVRREWSRTGIAWALSSRKATRTLRPNGKPDETAAGDIRKDVVVLGGGPAGSAIALALARRGYSVVVIERSDYKNTRLGETLPPAIRKALARLGVWGRFLGESHLPSFSIRSVWGSYDLHVNDLIF